MYFNITLTQQETCSTKEQETSNIMSCMSFQQLLVVNGKNNYNIKGLDPLADGTKWMQKQYFNLL